MKRASIYFITTVAILALVAVPALACNGTVGKAFKVKSDVDYWEQCNYYEPGQYAGIPVGPAYHFAAQTGGLEVYIHYLGEQEFTATDRLDRSRTHKVTWTRHVDGTATIYAYGTGNVAAMSMAMSAMPQLAVQADENTVPGAIFPFACVRITEHLPVVSTMSQLYDGPFVIQEVVKDIGNDSGCFDANAPAPTSFTDCLMSNNDNPWQVGLWNKVEYLNYHAKITGKQHVYNWTMEIREPGKICYQDRDGFDECYLFGQE